MSNMKISSRFQSSDDYDIRTHHKPLPSERPTPFKCLKIIRMSVCRTNERKSFVCMQPQKWAVITTSSQARSKYRAKQAICHKLSAERGFHNVRNITKGTELCVPSNEHTHTGSHARKMCMTACTAGRWLAGCLVGSLGWLTRVRAY